MVGAGGVMDDPPDDINDTVVPAQRVVSERAAAGPNLGHDLDDTIIRLVEPLPVPPTSSIDLSALRRPTALFAARDLMQDALVDAALATPATAWAIRVRGTTTIVPLDVPVVIGRRPGPPRPTEHPAPRRVVIPADRADVSARHARIEQLGESLVVADLGSTNGVVIHWSTGTSLRLRSAESCAVLPGAIIVLGDGVEIEFVAQTSPHTPRPSEPS